MEADDGALDWPIAEPCEKAWAATPTLPGVYKWFLQGNFPSDFDWPPPLASIKPGDLIYIGRATSLRARAKHHKLPTSKSTLRRALAALMGLQAEWQGSSAHPGLIPEHEKTLTNWMTNNLAMSFSPIDSISLTESTEKSLRTSLHPPLNRDGLTPEQEHTTAAAAAMQRNALGARGLGKRGTPKRPERPPSPQVRTPAAPRKDTIAERMALTKTLYEEGWTRSQIAERVGVHSSTVGDYIAKLRYGGQIDPGRSRMR
ncbi:helix-turn-helix domain-containing protein [Pseudarthrobacter oxydans]|uniref:GIY-YIG nuclease family protein n=1 Tax=Pseudarthrobacter oxydans TaxID=1671 RepID=UPI0015726ED5|nr:helix-turn-helix domain-containing protein [Pseudarthrobacter oxydans]